MPTSITPYLSVNDGAAAIDFYMRAFGAKETMRMTDESGRIHADLQIGEASFMISDEWPEGNSFSPTHYGGSTVSLALSVPDVDATFAAALAAGGTLDRPVEDQPYGIRSGWIHDPFGHRWNISTPIEDVSKDTLRERVAGSYSVS